MRQYAFPILINHPQHAPSLPRSCGSQEELDLLRPHGWYIEGEAPSPISPGDVPEYNADQSSRVETEPALPLDADEEENPDDVDETIDAMLSEGKKKKKAKKD